MTRIIIASLLLLIQSGCISSLPAPTDNIRPPAIVGEVDPLHDIMIEPENNDPYDREAQYGTWRKIKGTCYNVRAQVLIDESLEPVVMSGTTTPCRVISGKWHDPYTGLDFTDAKDVQIDHVVSLKEAHNSGASKWTQERRRDFANYLGNKDHLLAVSGSANAVKSDNELAEWWPSNAGNPDFDCDYVRIYTDIKREWGLSMDPKEAVVARYVFAECQ